MLDTERDTYAKHAVEWNELHPGKFAVVKGDSLAGVFDTMDEALAAGARNYGLQPFLVRQLGQPPEHISIPALAMGLLRARP